MNKIDSLKIVDQVCEVIPVVSTVSSLINIIQKVALEIFKALGNEIKNPYYKYLDSKSFSRCFAGLVPGLPHLIMTIEDIKQRKAWGV